MSRARLIAASLLTLGLSLGCGSTSENSGPHCGEASCVDLGGAYISHFTNGDCTGTESYYTPYFNSDGIRRSWDGQGIAGTTLRTVTNRSWKANDGAGDGHGCRVDEWPGGNTLDSFVTIYR